MPDQHHRCVRTERIGKADQIAGNLLKPIGLDGIGLVRTAIAAHVDRAGGEPGRGNRADLVTPGIPAFGKAVDHDRQRPLPLDRAAQAYLAGIDHPQFGHLLPSRLREGPGEGLFPISGGGRQALP